MPQNMNNPQLPANRVSIRLKNAVEGRKKKENESQIEQNSGSRRNSTDKENSKPKKVVKSSKPQKRPSSSSSGSEEPESKQAKSKTEEDSEPIEPFCKYDALPPDWVEKDWWIKPSTAVSHQKTTFSPNNDVIILDDDDDDDEKEESGDSGFIERKVLGRRMSVRRMEMELNRVESPNDYTQLIHVMQSFIHTLRDLNPKEFDQITDKIDKITETITAEKKNRSLNPHQIQIDYIMYRIFSSMSPDTLCKTEGIYTRRFFEIWKENVEAHYKNEEYDTKNHLIDLCKCNISSLRGYGEKMVIPCCSINEHLGVLIDRILEESRNL